MEDLEHYSGIECPKNFIYKQKVESRARTVWGWRVPNIPIINKKCFITSSLNLHNYSLMGDGGRKENFSANFFALYFKNFTDLPKNFSMTFV